jgi:PilX N-terminal
MIHKIISKIKKSKREKMTAKHGKFKKILESDRGYVLMLALVIMMTLTVIAVGYVTNVTLETSIVSNYEKNRDTLNAAEAGLEVAMLITHEEIITQLEPFSGTERVMSIEDNVTTYTYSFQPLFDDGGGVKVKYRIIPENPDPQKNRFLYRTYTSCQEIIHFAYSYAIEVVAEPSNKSGREYLKRQVRILETPLVQYFVFFDDDFTWHPGPEAIG